MTAADRATASERDSEPPAGRPSRLTVVSQHHTGASAPDTAAEPHDDAVRGALLAVCGLCGAIRNQVASRGTTRSTGTSAA